MSYFLEIWLRGFAKDYLRGTSTLDNEEYHPHITLVRPFQIRTGEEIVRQKIVDLCKGMVLLPFRLEGNGDFNGKFFYVPVVDCPELLAFDGRLEELLEPDVDFER